jgi:hypothetical protein
MWTNESNKPVNLIELSSNKIKQYKKLKKGEQVKKGDLLEIFEGCYARIEEKNILCKYKVGDQNVFLRKA